MSKCCQFRFVLTANSSSIVIFIFANSIDEKSRYNTIQCKALRKNDHNGDYDIAKEANVSPQEKKLFISDVLLLMNQNVQ